MGRHGNSDVKSEEHERNPGCMGGVLHILDYHHWIDAKRMSSHKKHNRRRLCYGNPQTLSLKHVNENQNRETQPLLDVESGQVEQHQTKQHMEEKLKGSSFSSSTLLKVNETDNLGYLTSEMNNKVLMVHKKTNRTNMRSLSLPNIPEYQVVSNRPIVRNLSGKLSHKQVKEYVDVLESFKVKNELFLKLLQDPEVRIPKTFRDKKYYDKLRKCGSFPVLDASSIQFLKPTMNLEHKKQENWPFAKGGNSLAPTEVTKLNADESNKDHNSVVKRGKNMSFEGLYYRGWNHMVKNHFKEIKQKIKHALWERKKNDALDCSRNEDASTKLIGEHETGDISKDKVHNKRKEAFLSDSFDRYTQLLGNKHSREASLHSKSLRLTNEDLREGPPKFFKRVSSLSDLETFSSLIHEFFHESLASDVPIIDPVDMNKVEKSEIVEETMVTENESMGGTVSMKDPIATEVGEDIDRTCDVTDTKAEEDMHFHEDQKSISNVNSCITDSAELQISRGSDFDIPENQPAFVPVLDNKSRSDISQDSYIKVQYENVEYANKADAHLLQARLVFEQSDILGDKNLEKWYSEDKPLDPLLLKELTPFLLNELDCSPQIMCDLINEALINIHDQFVTYFPRPFSFTCIRICPVPKGEHLLNEVKCRISWHVNNDWPKVDQSLDDIMARDFDKGDTWMNLETEAAVVTMELEDLILDEIVDEILDEISW